MSRKGGSLPNMGSRNAYGNDSMGLWKHGVEQILAEVGMQNRQTERKTHARHISTKEGALCADEE